MNNASNFEFQYWANDNKYYALTQDGELTGWTLRFSNRRNQWQIFDEKDRVLAFGYEQLAEAVDVIIEQYQREQSPADGTQALRDRLASAGYHVNAQ